MMRFYYSSGEKTRNGVLKSVKQSNVDLKREPRNHQCSHKLIKMSHLKFVPFFFLQSWRWWPFARIWRIVPKFFCFVFSRGVFFSNGKRCEGVPARGIGSIHAHPYWVGWEDASLRRHGNIWQVIIMSHLPHSWEKEKKTWTRKNSIMSHFMTSSWLICIWLTIKKQHWEFFTFQPSGYKFPRNRPTKR